jgi:hypothetical protein
MKTRSQSRAEEQKSEDCSICLQKMNDYVITVCNHVFCDSCLIQHLLNDQTCPLCRKDCNPEDIISQIMSYNFLIFIISLSLLVLNICRLWRFFSIISISANIQGGRGIDSNIPLYCSRHCLYV